MRNPLSTTIIRSSLTVLRTRPSAFLSALVLVATLSVGLVRMHAAESDTLRLRLREADSLLVARNLDLIAARYEVDRSKAREVQASVFDNPSLSVESFLYSPERKGVFDPSFQKSVGLQQVFQIAGQRGLRIDIAEGATQMSLAQYDGVALALRYQLHSMYYQLYYLRQATNSLRSQLERLDGTVRAYETQYAKGNFSLKDLARLKTTLFQLNNSYGDLLREIADLRRDMGVLLADSRVIVAEPDADELRIPSALSADSVDGLVRTALEERYDVKMLTKAQELASMNVQLQKRSAIPDMHVGLNYDQGGSIITHYTGLSLGFDLPLFNRNQGGIAEAEVNTLQAEAELRSLKNRVLQEVRGSVSKAITLHKEYEQIGTKLLTDIDTLSESVLQNYLNGNLSLLEFTDLFESYNSSIIDIHRFYATLLSSYEYVSYTVGKNVFR